MIRYVFKDEPLAFKASAKADAQKIGEALERIQKAAAGRLTPAAVVDAARPKNSVLHKHFEWDDATAAEAYRHDQARAVIRVVRVEGDDDELPRAFVSVADKGGVSYRHVEEVKSSLDLQIALLRSARRDFASAQRKYREFTDICELAGQAEERAGERLKSMEDRPAA